MKKDVYQTYCQGWIDRLSSNEQSIERILALIGSLYRSSSHLNEVHLEQVMELPLTLANGSGGDGELVSHIFEQVRGVGDELRLIREHMHNLQVNHPDCQGAATE